MSGADEIGRLREAVDSLRSNIGTKPRQVWYVDGTNGHANYDGLSRLSPFPTIALAVTAASAGDVIHIAEGTYDEATSIPAGLAGLEVICEPGVILNNTTPGTVVAIAAPHVRWQAGVINQAGQIGLAVNGAHFRGVDIKATGGTGFDLNGEDPVMLRCQALATTTAGFNIIESGGAYIGCLVHGAAASRGFYLSHTNAEDNILARCCTLGCTAAGYETVAGADNNLFSHCSQSSLCAGPTDAGANNTWPMHTQGSQLVAGNTIDEDVAILAAYVDALETRLTAARAGYLDGIPRVLCSMDFWSAPQEELGIPAVAGTQTLPSVTVADLPAGATIVRAIAMVKFRMIDNINAGANKLDGATVASTSQVIQVRDDTPGTWRDAINFVDDQFGLAATTREGGDVLIGSIDIAVEVDGNDTYNFQYLLAKADLASINWNDLQTGLRILYSV